MSSARHYQRHWRCRCPAGSVVGSSIRPTWKTSRVFLRPPSGAWATMSNINRPLTGARSPAYATGVTPAIAKMPARAFTISRDVGNSLRLEPTCYKEPCLRRGGKTPQRAAISAARAAGSVSFNATKDAIPHGRTHRSPRRGPRGLGFADDARMQGRARRTKGGEKRGRPVGLREGWDKWV